MQKSRFLIILIIFILAACGPAGSNRTTEDSGTTGDSTPAAAEPTEPTTSTELEHINVGVGFIPNIQFSPFYVAQAKGFYADEGLDVALEYGFENDFVTLTATNERQFAVASGDQVILARAQELPIVYVMKWYERFPVGIVALTETGINAPEDLEGKSVGIPGLFGASYVAWRGLIYATGLDESTITVEEIGFAQAEAISQHQVDAAVVYIANEPVQLSKLGQDVNVIEVSDYINLVSNGLVTNETVIKENPDLVQRMVRGTLRGLAYTIANPDEAFEIARQFVPEITDDDASTQRAVLDASIELWRSEQPGMSNPQAWTDSAKFMVETGLIESPVEVDTLYTNEFVEE
jgi:NitT/TauT family transport system substrate-binding protein